MRQVLLASSIAFISNFAQAEESGCTYRYLSHPGVTVETSVAEAQQNGVMTVKFMRGASDQVATAFAKVVREGEKSVALYGVILTKETCPFSFSLPSEVEDQVTIEIEEASEGFTEFRSF
jgi:hypothetical protein